MAVPLANDFTTLVLIGLVTGFGNGLGSGIVMTLGADFSPVVGRGEFLGVWRLIGDAGNAGGPFVVSCIVGVASLGLASICSGALGLAGALLMWDGSRDTAAEQRERTGRRRREG